MENHEKFLKNLDQSQVTVNLIADWLRGKGRSVTVPVATKAQSHADWKNHADSGDLIVHQRLEVKRSSRDFTGQDNYPFKHFLVAAVHAFDNAVPKPHSYIIVNRSGTHAGVVMSSTKPQWFVKEITDARYENYKQRVYATALDVVQWMRLS